MKLKKILTIGVCGLIALASIISNFTVHAQETQSVEISIKMTGGNGVVEIEGNDETSQSAIDDDTPMLVQGEDSFKINYTTEPCEYEYTVKQTAVASGYTFDETEYTVHVFIAQEKDGLVPTVAVWKKGTETKCASVSFDNKAPTVSKKGKKSTDTNDKSKVYEWGGIACGALACAAFLLLVLKKKDKKETNEAVQQNESEETKPEQAEDSKDGDSK